MGKFPQLATATLMPKITLEKFISTSALTLLVTLFFLGGLGVELPLVYLLGIIVAILLLFLAVLKNGKIVFPKGALLYFLFLVLFAVSTFWSVDKKASLEYLLLFTSGLLIWISIYNLYSEVSYWFEKLVIIIGFIFGFLFVVNRFFGNPDLVRPWSLHLQYTAYLNHKHIGDLWAVVLTIVAYKITRTNRIWYWLTVPPGIYLLLESQSRSAYVALAAGVSYFAVNRFAAKYKKILTLMILVSAALFVITGAAKPTILTRQYFIQGILGIIHNPFGIGAGNFGIISSDPENWLFGLSHLSKVAHNIFLEILAGMGIFGSVFIFWFLVVAKEVWAKKDNKNTVFGAVFFAISANFFFDSTYFVPAMLWLWFGSLALSQHRNP